MSDVDNKTKMIVEGLLLAAGKPLDLDVIAAVFSEDERPEKGELREILAVIAEDCKDRGFELKEVASGFRFQVKQDLSEWIARLWEERPPRYSRALLETLALIAYRQPITRGDIEDIRGVSVSSTIVRTLLDREWVRIVGHKDVPGKPALFATTKQFLDYFNLNSIQELPPLSEIQELGKDQEEYDVEDDLADRNVLELPDAEAIAEENESFLGNFEPDELLEESEAVALAKKPLNEILGINEEESEDVDMVFVETTEDNKDENTESNAEETTSENEEQDEKVSQIPASNSSIH
jgi:segregation and condensation protein B